jgi:hypothetical protein
MWISQHNLMKFLMMLFYLRSHNKSSEVQFIVIWLFTCLVFILMILFVGFTTVAGIFIVCYTFTLGLLFLLIFIIRSNSFLSFKLLSVQLRFICFDIFDFLFFVCLLVCLLQVSLSLSAQVNFFLTFV